MGQCTCGLLHAQINSFTMLFSMPNNHHSSFDDTDHIYPFVSSSSSSSSSSVDCTLSLGTPSTRLTDDNDKRSSHESHRSSCMSNFCWGTLQTKNTHYYSPQTLNKTSRGTNTSTNNNSANNYPLLTRRCANCDTTSTPLWRNGPKGPKSLCNACGIRFKKEERRAKAASGNGNNGSSGSSRTMEHQLQYGYNQNNSWVQSQKMPSCFSSANEFRFIEESDRDSDTAIPFLSWRLNVAGRPSLVHDFTR